MDYIPIRVSTLRGDQQIGFDAYMKLNDKYLLYLRRGDSFEGQRLTRLREKKLRRMYILAQDEPSYRRYLTANVDAAFDAKNTKPLEMRAEIVQGTQQAQAEELMESPAELGLYNESKEYALKFADFIQREQQAINHILGIKNLDANIAQHGVNVSTLAVALAAKLGITDVKSKQLIVVGSLIHDIEHYNSGLNIQRPHSSMTAEELKLYKTHPMVGAQKLIDKKHFDQQVLHIISQHEEFIDGNGFPQGLRESAIDPLALIVGSANALDRKLSFESVPRAEVMKQMMIKTLGQRPLTHLQFLGEIING